MYGQGYRNKAERKSNSRFVVSEKNKPGYGQKKEGGYAQNERKKPSCGRCKKHLTKPSAFESEIHPSHKLRLCSRVFRPAGSYCSRKRQLVRKRMPIHPLTNEMAEFILPKTRRECLSEEIHLFK